MKEHVETWEGSGYAYYFDFFIVMMISQVFAHDQMVQFFVYQ